MCKTLLRVKLDGAFGCFGEIDICGAVDFGRDSLDFCLDRRLKLVEKPAGGWQFANAVGRLHILRDVRLASNSLEIVGRLLAHLDHGARKINGAGAAAPPMIGDNAGVCAKLARRRLNDLQLFIRIAAETINANDHRNAEGSRRLNLPPQIRLAAGANERRIRLSIGGGQKTANNNRRPAAMHFERSNRRDEHRAMRP